PVGRQVEGRARRASGLGGGDPLLNPRVRKLRVRAKGPVVDERATGNGNGAARDRDVGVLRPPVRPQMTHPQFRDLTRCARGGVLMALAAGLGVVEWS